MAVKKKRAFQEIASKGLKTIILEHDSWMKPYMPKTVWYREDRLLAMLDTFGTVFVKPDKGGGGVGIIRVKKVADELVECKSLKHHKIVPKDKVIALIDTYLKPNKRYLIQQGIRLATINGRPFDIRLMLQRIDHKWELTGLAAKLAAPGKIVTNFCKGGKPYTAKDAVAKVFPNNVSKKMEELKKLAYRVAHVLSNRFKGLRELGIDAGLDINGNIWVFEVNTRPTYGMFRELKNLQMYNNIRRIRKLIV
ncbi:YheC/YheD family protein [Shimazuella sp. AN120528]|uniref:YheC/YheD family protein n=1 Tax=Shimazuella soli TaxID=1892854 RepID=UPI001F0DE775|nr:YheC/YheD family protein [Shimazuella soli]MCH5585082.1 YheC/YheD family protein [Shimazuella soli]